MVTTLNVLQHVPGCFIHQSTWWSTIDMGLVYVRVFVVRFLAHCNDANQSLTESNRQLTDFPRCHRSWDKLACVIELLMLVKDALHVYACIDSCSRALLQVPD